MLTKYDEIKECNKMHPWIHDDNFPSAREFLVYDSNHLLKTNLANFTITNYTIFWKVFVYRLGCLLLFLEEETLPQVHENKKLQKIVCFTTRIIQCSVMHLRYGTQLLIGTLSIRYIQVWYKIYKKIKLKISLQMSI